MDFDKIKSIIILVIAIIILYFIYKIFIKKNTENTDAAKDISESKGADAGYWAIKQKITIPALGGKEMAQIAENIHDSMHGAFIGIKDTALMSSIYRLKTLRQLSQVVNYYNIKYKKNMMTDIAETLSDSTINKFASNGALSKINDYIKKLPKA